MKKAFISLFAVISLFSVSSFPLKAENNQYLIFGMSYGPHLFEQEDDFRNDSSKVNRYGSLFKSENHDPIESGAAISLFTEWYLFEELGIGLKYYYSRFTNNSTAENNIGHDLRIKREVIVTHNIFTINHVPFNGNGFARMMLMVGAGGSNYAFNENLSDKNDPDYAYNISGSVEGFTKLAGVCMDWGGDEIGARLGLEAFNSAYQKISIKTVNGENDTMNVDGSGLYAYLSGRWAF